MPELNTWFTHPTGDPFSDIGGYVIKTLHQRFPDKDILGLIEYVTKIYVDKWKAKINPFFLNSKVTQPAFNAQKKIEETQKYFAALLNGTEKNDKGFCRITGQETLLFAAGRDNSILSGSSTFVNFHHTFDGGIMLSKEAIIRFHFVPLGCVYLLGKIALIHSNNQEITEFFAQTNCNLNLDAIAKGASEGILRSPCKSPGTALFRFVEKIVLDTKKELGQVIRVHSNNSMTLYHFTNFGASPEVSIYQVPAKVFDFHRAMQTSSLKKDWADFVNSHYRSSEYKKAQYQKETRRYEWEQKGGKGFIEESDYQNWSNPIYDKLIEDRSILRSFMYWSVENKLNFNIVEIYQQYIRNMKKETIAKIQEMAEFILNANDEQGVVKSIKALNNAKSSYLLRRFIINDIVIKYSKENEGILLTVEDYTEYLFPDSSSWQETRDVLLIAIFQKIHERKIKIEKEELITEETE
ncbi:type I-B CRISPR-associated protein Cas8b1/Cst1 [Bacteroides sp. 214]|nr:type I-B CRISPR-associated protein Cas8b1/Cst1 [Bacteroides sp. 214]